MDNNPSAYRQTAEYVLKNLKVTTDKGLSTEEYHSRIRRFGKNELLDKGSKNPIILFLSQFTNPLVILLLVAGIISVILAEFLDAAFITVIVLINAAVGFIQEYKAENTVKALRRLLSPKASVVRNGESIEIDSVNLVPGDIVHITAGSSIPADIRLIDVQNLRTDESALTGESTPVDKNAQTIEDEKQVPEQHNMVFMGTTAIAGKALGVVVSTGNQTYLGSIAKRTRQTRREKSPLVQKFSRFSKTIGGIVIASSIVIVLILLIRGESFAVMMKTVVGVSVAAIPESLPIIATIALSITMQKMAKKKAIIRQLSASETLGSTTVICTDKTGTLTMNQMSVVKLYDGNEEYDTDITYKNSSSRLSKLLSCGALCTENPEIHEDQDASLNLDPTESAVVKSSLNTKIPKEELKQYQYLDILPFQNEKRMMAVLLGKEKKRKIFVKGSPEKIFELCNVPKNSAYRRKVDEFAQNGLRLIACAEKDLHAVDTLSDDHLNSGFDFLGLFALVDPPRSDVKKAIDECKTAGIHIVMITGDHPLTATAIAKQLGIADDEQMTITGSELLHMSDRNLSNSIKKVSVFARVTPDQKLRIVEAYKEAGEIVAVTGDGVNDAPALRSAHIGVAMGGRGTDVAKEASQMVILDDSFSTIVKAIKEARVLFENIRKATFFLVPTGFSVILTVLIAILLGYPMPYTPIQLLWVNMVTNGFQDLSLAFEKEENGIMSKSPRRPGEGIMSALLYRRSVLVAGVITVGVLFMYISALNRGVSQDEARTVALSTMIIFQFFQLFNSRSETRSVFRQNPFSNRVLILSMVIALIAFVLTLTFHPLQFLLETTSLSKASLMEITLIAFSILVIVEIDKALTRKLKKR